jgi:hypothetical protein
MQFGKKLLSGLGAVLLAALLLVVAAPKTVHAVVAALVEVSNTPSNPAITLEEEAQAAFVVNGSCLINTITCSIYPLYSVPENKIAVIESASEECYLDPGTTVNQSYLSFNFNQPQYNQMSLFFPPPQTTPFNGRSSATTALNLKSYAIGPIGFFVTSSNSQSQLVSNCFVTLSGHLE